MCWMAECERNSSLTCHSCNKKFDGILPSSSGASSVSPDKEQSTKLYSITRTRFANVNLKYICNSYILPTVSFPGHNDNLPTGYLLIYIIHCTYLTHLQFYIHLFAIMKALNELDISKRYVYKLVP